LCTTFATTSTIIFLAALPRDAVIFFAIGDHDEVDYTAVTIQACLL
jgi:hypothetical protein